MSALAASSETVVAYLGYLLESGTISAKSLQPYLSTINVVHDDFEYPPLAWGGALGQTGPPVRALLNCKVLPCYNRSKSQRFQQSTCSPSSCTAFDPTLLSTRFVCARVSRLSSPSSVVLNQVSSSQYLGSLMVPPASVVPATESRDIVRYLRN
jgi:hypothetical protein